MFEKKKKDIQKNSKNISFVIENAQILS